MPDKPVRQRRELTLTPATDAELDALSEVGPRDIPEADVEWRRVAPKGFRPVLMAAEE